MPDLSSFSDDVSLASKFSTSSKVSKSSTRSKKSKKSSKKDGGASGTKEPQKPEWTQEIIQSGLSQLGRTADGLRAAYLTLQVTGTSLQNTAPLSAYQHIQTLLIRNNDLIDLSTLGNLQSLTHLDASGNKLTNVLGFTLPPECENNLRYADFSSNLVTSIDNLSAFSRLLTLDLSSNQVERICGLRGLQMLQRLSLSNNKLVSCMGLEELSSLRDLDLSDNVLMSLEPISPLVGLEVLNVAGNQLVQLRGLDSLVALRQLDVSRNLIPSLDCIAHVQEAALLSELTTMGNPLDRCMNVRLHIVHLLPQVTILNGMPVEAKEKVISSNMHGADAEALRTIRRKYFPNGELDDGGGAPPPPSAGLIASKAEEEQEETMSSEFLRVDAWARSLAPGSSSSSSSTPTPGSPRPWWSAALAVAAVLKPTASVVSSPSLLTLVEGNEEEDPTGAGEAAASASSVPASAALSPMASMASMGVPEAGDVAALVARSAEAAPLLCLADQLASVCGESHLLIARACWQWVAAHTVPPKREDTWSVTAPLFGAGNGGESMTNGEVAELALLNAAKNASGGAGAWSERAAWLFVQLARACHLEAVLIPGYWRNGTLPPGSRFEAHNHCWAAVKVGRRWRLIDPTAAALGGGAGASPGPFFVPPEALIYTYFPLEAQWQLLDNPISLNAWWDLPECSVSFFARGCKLMDFNSGLHSINVLSSFKEGDRMPCLQVDIYAWQQPGSYLSHSVHDAVTGKLVGTWPQKSGFTSSTGQLLFQQVSYGPGTRCAVEFGATTFPTQTTQILATFPRPGEYNLEVHNVTELPGGVPLQVDGKTLTLRLAVSDEVLRVKVVVPEPEAHDPEDGILHDPANPVILLPSTHPGFIRGRCELVSPLPTAVVEADRTETFEVIAPGANRVIIAGPSGETIAELKQLSELMRAMSYRNRPSSAVGDGPARFRLELQVPRVSSLTLKAYFVHHGALAGGEWTPLLTIQVLPQGQHIIEQAEDLDVPEIDPEDPSASQAVDLFRAMDKNQDGMVTRAEMLVAFRHNRQIADILKMPPRIRLHDGTYDRFVAGFLSIDQVKLGTFGFNELCAYMGITPPEPSDEEGSSDEEAEDEEGEGESASRPLSPDL